MGPLHPLASYLQIAPDLGDDAGVVDTFLHGREEAYSIDECRALVEESGLAFQDLFLRASYYPPTPTTSPFFTAVAAMPREQQWSIMQRINASNACHYFLACRPERPAESYAINFDSEAALDYVPSFRKACGLIGSAVRRHDGWTRELTSLEAALVEHIDGRRSIAEIIDVVTGSGTVPRADRDAIARTARETFRSLWQVDLLAMRIRR